MHDVTPVNTSLPHMSYTASISHIVKPIFHFTISLAASEMFPQWYYFFQLSTNVNGFLWTFYCVYLLWNVQIEMRSTPCFTRLCWQQGLVFALNHLKFKTLLLTYVLCFHIFFFNCRQLTPKSHRESRRIIMTPHLFVQWWGLPNHAPV